MGKEGLRYAAKVDLNKPAADQEVLHASAPKMRALVFPANNLAEPLAPRQ